MVIFLASIPILIFVSWKCCYQEKQRKKKETWKRNELNELKINIFDNKSESLLTSKNNNIINNDDNEDDDDEYINVTQDNDNNNIANQGQYRELKSFPSIKREQQQQTKNNNHEISIEMNGNETIII